ncbi:MAG: nucleotidyltransferase domain-containing protein [Defluviitaleaceae bacterium]|nr:nucleotidyltransferase domain-containing protein [Defluviitaleaceae bacterium]
MNPEILTYLRDAAKSYESIEKIVLFGSRASGSFQTTSDFDICVHCEDERAFTNFYFDLDDLDTHHTIEVLRYEDIENDTLKEEIAKDGVILYEREN